MEMTGKPCGIKIVENESKSVDEVATVIVEVDMSIQITCPHSQSPIPSGRHSNSNEEPKTPEMMVLKGSNICDEFNYMAASESIGALAPSKSTSRHWPDTHEIERRSSVKRRLVFPDMDTSSVANPTLPQKSPKFSGPSLGGIPRPGIFFSGNKKTDENNPSRVGDKRKKPSPVGDLRKWLR